MADSTASNFLTRATCPGCGSATATSLYRAPFDAGPTWSFLAKYYAGRVDASWLRGGEYRVDRCAECTLAFQREIGSDALLEQLYDRWLNSEYHPDRDPDVQAAVNAPQQSRDGHELMAVAATLGKPVETLRVLDFGMGWGAWARVAHGLKARVFGFDLSRTRREFARGHGIEVVDRDGLAGLEVDFVNTEQVFEHVTQPFDDARDLARALRAGGILKIAVPQAPGLERRIARMDWEAPRNSQWSLNAIHPLEHVNCWNDRALEVLARRVGLERTPVGLRAYLAFLGRPGSLDRRSPKQVAKALLRPAYHAFNRSNLYGWFRKPAD